MIQLYSLNNQLDKAIAILEKGRGVFIPNALTAQTLFSGAMRDTSFDPSNIKRCYLVLKSMGCEPASKTLSEVIVLWVRYIEEKKADDSKFMEYVKCKTFDDEKKMLDPPVVTKEF